MEVKLSYHLPSPSASFLALPCVHAVKWEKRAEGLFKGSSFQMPELKRRDRRRKKLHASCITVDTSIRDFSVDSVLPPKTRRLILLRHGKSSWADSSVKDHDRPLNEQGRMASASLGNKLQSVGWLPDLILCSDSLRTRETLDMMKEHVNEFRDIEVHFLGSFYSVAAMDGHTADHLQDTICKFARDDIFTVMCMGHNRGWEEAASIFSGSTVELKTANAALLETIGNSWQEAFESGVGGWTLSSILKPDDVNATNTL